MTKLTLISSATCPYVQRAIIALKEKGAAFDVVYVNLMDKPDWFLKLSPLGKVPVVKVEREGKPDAVIFESSVIVEFVEETSPGPKLHPADPVEKAQHRAWMEFGSATLGDLNKLWFAKDQASYDTAREAVIKKLQRLEETVAGPFFAGPSLSCVDTVFGPIFRQIDTVEALTPLGLLAGLPKVQTWSKALAARKSVQEAVPDNYAELFAGRLKRMEAHVLKVPA
jgi:glutathione S-transferase